MVKDFKHAVMSYYTTEKSKIESHGAGDLKYNYDLLIPARDLFFLAEAIADTENFATTTRHRLVFHDPLNKFRNTEYDSKQLHAVLLEPFIFHFWSFAHFKIEGDIDPEQAASAQVKVTSMSERVVDHAVFLSEINKFKDIAGGFVRQRGDKLSIAIGVYR